MPSVMDSALSTETGKSFFCFPNTHSSGVAAGEHISTHLARLLPQGLLVIDLALKFKSFRDKLSLPLCRLSLP